jgi:hypothetical protein
MTSLCSIVEFTNEFGSLHNEAKEIVTKTYPFLYYNDGQFYYRFNLKELFSEAIDLFSVDPSLVVDSFTINTIFADESIDPDITMILSELVQKGIEYNPITDNGEFWMTFSDIRTFYGKEQFDAEMTELFPEEYLLFMNYFTD